MKTRIIDCTNGPVIVTDFCVVETPRRIQLRIGVAERGKGRWAALTPRQASDLVMALQAALHERLLEEPKRRPEVVLISADNCTDGVLH